RREFRGAVYHIEVQNPGRVTCGIAGLAIDGVAAKLEFRGRGVLLPVFPPGAEHRVLVTMGRT
ncbi:MAG: hypothetical protein IT282_09490, partial [Bacteroidetes bacterium]|nr:hypothetical protein [Bacteroidota bacterium]